MKVLPIIFLVSLLCGCAGNPSIEDGVIEPPLTEEEQFQQAEQNRLQGRYGEALSGFAPLTESEGEWAMPSKLAIAQVMLDQGKNQEALRAYHLILAEQPDNLTAQEGRGLAWLGLGEWKQARAQLTKVNQTEPGRWRVLNGLGVAADMNGDFAAAARWYGEALQAGGERPMVINNAGYSLIMAGDYRAAEQLLERGALRFPDEHRINHNLAIAQARQGRYNDAIRTWRKTMERVDALNNAGYIAKLNGDTEKARAMFNEAAAISTRYRPRVDANLRSLDGGAVSTSRSF